MRLVATGLSRAGYVTVATTMGLENILDHTEGFVARFDRERGRDPGLYYLRVFGDPGDAIGSVVYLAADASRGVTGSGLVADGGTTCFVGGPQMLGFLQHGRIPA